MAGRAGKFKKYLGEVFDESKEGAKRIYNTPNAIVNGAVDGATWAAKQTNKVVPLTRKTEANIGNLWTGRREGPGALMLGSGIGLGYVGYSTVKQTTLAPKTGEISYGGTAPIMDADGVGSRSQAPTLGAGGNMVFGLHNARKG